MNLLLDEDVKQISYDQYIVYNKAGFKKATEDYLEEFSNNEKLLENIEDEPSIYPCLIMIDTTEYPYNKLLVKSISLEELKKHI